MTTTQDTSDRSLAPGLHPLPDDMLVVCACGDAFPSQGDCPSCLAKAYANAVAKRRDARLASPERASTEVPLPFPASLVRRLRQVCHILPSAEYSESDPVVVVHHPVPPPWRSRVGCVNPEALSPRYAGLAVLPRRRGEHAPSSAPVLCRCVELSAPDRVGLRRCVDCGRVSEEVAPEPVRFHRPRARPLAPLPLLTPPTNRRTKSKGKHRA